MQPKNLIISVIALFIFSSGFAQNYQHPPGKYVTVNGARLWVETEGSGEPIIPYCRWPRQQPPVYATPSMHERFLPAGVYRWLRKGKSDTAKTVTEYSIARDVEDVEGVRKA